MYISPIYILMGANVSKTVQSITQETISTAVTNVLTSQTAQCSANATTDQTLSITNSGSIKIGDISFDSNVDVSFKCVQTLSITADVTSALQTSLDAAASSLTQQLQPLLTANISDTEQNVIQKACSSVATNITSNQMASAITNTLAKQGFNVDNVAQMEAGNISYKIKANIVTTAIQSLSAVTSATNTITTALAAKTAATTKQGIDIAGLFGPIILIIIVLLIVVLIFPSTILKLIGGTAKSVVSLPGNAINSFTTFTSAGTATPTPSPPIPKLQE